MATKTIVRYRNRPKRKSRRRNGFTIPIAAAVPLVYVGYNSLLYAVNQSPQVALEKTTKWFTGYSIETGRWSWENLKFGLFPVIGGIMAHKVASKLGVNRALASAGVPWLRV